MHFLSFLIVFFSSSLFYYFVLFFYLSCFFVFSMFSFMSFLFLFSFLVTGSCPFSSISVSFCLLDWVLLLSFSSFFSCFFISFVLSFVSSLLASHCWEAIVFSVSLMYFEYFFKFSISSFVEEVILSSLVFVFSLSFCCLLFTALFALLYNLHLLYSAHLCLYFFTTQLSILDTYLYLLKLSLLLLLSSNKLELHFFPSIYFFEFLYYLLFHTLLSNISALLLIYLAILHWWQIGCCSFLHDFIRYSFDPHA